MPEVRENWYPQLGEPFYPQAVFIQGGWFVGPIVPDALMAYKGLSLSAKAVWIVLSSHARKEGECFPSKETIAKGTGTSERTVDRALRELKDEGFVEWVRGHTGKSNRYQLLWHPIFEQAKNEAGAKSQKARDKAIARWLREEAADDLAAS